MYYLCAHKHETKNPIMSKKIGYLQRWMFIIDRISSHPYISKEELIKAVEEEIYMYDGVEEVGTAVRTIERDLSEIRSSPYMDISIEYSRQKRGYYIPQNEKSLSKLDRLFELSSLFSFGALKNIVFIEDRQSRGLEHRFMLISAIRNMKEIIIDYRKYDKSSSSETRRLQPYALKEFRKRWYLLAINSSCEPKNEDSLRTFGLDRIEKCTVTDRKFQKDMSINPNKEFEYCFGIISVKDLKPEKLVLSFDPVAGKYYEACPLHKSQRVLISNEEEIRIELTVKLTFDFIIELLGQSRGMRVIEPLSLKEKLIAIHRDAIDLLQK